MLKIGDTLICRDTGYHFVVTQIGARSISYRNAVAEYSTQIDCLHQQFEVRSDGR